MIPTYQMDVLGLRALTQQGIARMINEGARNLHTPLQSGMYGTPRYGNLTVELHLPDKNFSNGQSRLQDILPASSPNVRQTEKRYNDNIYAYAKYARVGCIKSALNAAYAKAETEIKNAVAKVYNSGKRFFGRKHRGQLGLEQIMATS